MSDQIYRLVVEMGARGSLGGDFGKLEKIGGNIDGMFASIGGKIGDIGSSAASMFAGAVEGAASLAVSMAKIGAVGGAGLAGLGVKLNAELEDAKTSLAGMFTAQGLTGGLNEGLDVASKTLKDMRKDAADLPGEFKDLVGIFRNVVTPGGAAGASIDRMEKLSASAMSVSAALGVHMDQAGREMGMLLQGRAGSHVVLGNLLGLSGDKAEAFNKMSGMQRMETIEKELAKYGALNAAYANNYSALSSTLIDNGKQFLVGATAGLFERVKTTMADANKWFASNGPLINSWATYISDHLVLAFDKGKRFIEEWFPVMRSFAGELEERIVGGWRKVEPIVSRIFGKVGESMKDGSMMGHLASIGGLYGAAKLAPSMVSGMGSIAGAAGLGGAATAGIGAAVAAGVVADVMAVTHVLTDSSSEMYASANEHWTNMKASFGGAMWHFQNALDRLEPIGLKIADLYGNWVVGQLDRAAWALEKFGYAIDTLTGGISRGIDTFKTKLDLLKEYTGIGAGPKINDNNGEWWKQFSVDRPERDVATVSTVAAAAMQQLDNHPQTKRVTGGGGTTIQKVEVVVSGADDPERVARLTTSKLLEIARNPLRSAGQSTATSRT